MSPNPPVDLDRYRPLLRLQVRQMELDPRLLRRFDSSDIIQETLLRAHANLARFRGQSEAELVKWLQEILANVVTDEARKARARKRDVALEQSLEAMMAESSARLERYLANSQASPSSPSWQVERQELLLALAAAIDQLPEDQRDVLIQRDLNGASVSQIAEQLGRTEKSIAGLLLRGRRKLRELLQDEM
jgi:RNA polymerase sigma-70 factor (ECF subfamily)